MCLWDLVLEDAPEPFQPLAGGSDMKKSNSLSHLALAAAQPTGGFHRHTNSSNSNADFSPTRAPSPGLVSSHSNQRLASLGAAGGSGGGSGSGGGGSSTVPSMPRCEMLIIPPACQQRWAAGAHLLACVCLASRPSFTPNPRAVWPPPPAPPWALTCAAPPALPLWLQSAPGAAV
jgi:hypothetical protein